MYDILECLVLHVYKRVTASVYPCPAARRKNVEMEGVIVEFNVWSSPCNHVLLPQECVVRIAAEVVSRLLIIGTNTLLIEVFDSYMPTNVENQHVRFFFLIFK